jgi:ABC-type sugar transport system ATPase subunit
MNQKTEFVAEMLGITKKFGSTYALKGVDLSIMRGEVHALLGRNGAGKSTLVSALSGLTPADDGTIRIGEQEVTATGQSYAPKLRNLVAHVQQTPQLFDMLTVSENLFIENPQVRNRFGVVSRRKGTALAQDLIGQWNIDIELEALAAGLSAESRQLLEIMKALGRGVPLIILDEPTAALSSSEKQLLFQNVKRLKQSGISFVYISHHLDEIFQVADVVTILRDGASVLERHPVAELEVGELANLMVGEEVQRSARINHSRDLEPPLLHVKGLKVEDQDHSPISFELRPGEIVALAGPVGGGKEKVGEIIAGSRKAARGEVVGSKGKKPDVGFVPSDRHQSGYIGILSIRENISSGGLDVVSGPGGLISARRESELSAELASKTNVIASSLEQPVAQLSGGNQQKVVFARALCRAPQVIVALSPTRGVDIAAKEQLYQLLRDLASDGIGVLIVSDEHEEIEQIANRVIVIVDNQVSAVLEGDYTAQDLVLRMEGIN